VHVCPEDPPLDRDRHVPYFNCAADTAEDCLGRVAQQDETRSLSLGTELRSRINKLPTPVPKHSCGSMTIGDHSLGDINMSGDDADPRIIRPDGRSRHASAGQRAVVSSEYPPKKKKQKPCSEMSETQR